MSWNEIAGFAAMGGYAAYVWGSVAAVVLLMVAETATLATRERDNASRDSNIPEETHR